MTDIVDRLRREVVWESDVGDVLNAAADEIASLREAIRSLAEQDATLSVQGGSVTVTMDGTLTDEEREAIKWCRDNITAMAHPSSAFSYIHADTLRNLLERLHT